VETLLREFLREVLKADRKCNDPSFGVVSAGTSLRELLRDIFSDGRKCNDPSFEGGASLRELLRGIFVGNRWCTNPSIEGFGVPSLREFLRRQPLDGGTLLLEVVIGTSLREPLRGALVCCRWVIDSRSLVAGLSPMEALRGILTR